MTAEHLKRLSNLLIAALKEPITILNFTFSWWEVMFFEVILFLIMCVIYDGILYSE